MESAPSIAGARQDIRRLTQRIVELHAKTAREDAVARVAIGELLRAVRDKLAHGEWNAWIDEQLPLGRSTVRNHIQLAAFAGERPERFEELASLGTSKLYLLIKLPARELDGLVAAQPLPVPGTDLRLPLARMSVDQLWRILLARAGKAQRDPGAAQVVRGYRRRLRALLRDTAKVTAVKKSIATADAAELHRMLIEAATRLAKAFELPDT